MSIDTTLTKQNKTKQYKTKQKNTKQYKTKPLHDKIRTETIPVRFLSIWYLSRCEEHTQVYPNQLHVGHVVPNE